jgi:hypothetical protein
MLVIQCFLANPTHKNRNYRFFLLLHRFTNTCTNLHKLKRGCTNVNQKSRTEYHTTTKVIFRMCGNSEFCLTYMSLILNFQNIFVLSENFQNGLR